MGLHLLYSKHMEKFLTKKIRLRPRLQAAADMINGSHLAADIGCDHGRLSVALLQQGRADRVIASDISAPSLQKATELAALCGLGSRLTTVLSDGMAHLGPDEADAIAICGMGGELIARILEANLPAAKNARCITMQPMRGIEELRQFLRKNEFRIIDERLVLDAGRIYQIIAAKSGDPAPLPGWFPQDEYSFGPMLFEKRDPLLIPLLEGYRDGHLRRLVKAKRKGVTPKALTEIIGRMNVYINIAQEMHKNEAE